MAEPKSHAVLEQDIAYIKDDIKDIKKKLDNKFVSHETFELATGAINKSVQTIVYVGAFLLTPIYGAIIALLFKMFSQ